MSLKRYDAKQITLFFAGLLIDSGFADGEFVTIEQDAPDYEKYVGTDGQVTRSRTNNRAATIHVKLASTSQGNTLLGALSNLGLAAANGADIGPMMIRDRVSGVCTYTAANCWIEKPPDVSYDRQTTVRDWTLACDELVRVDAGS